MKEIKTLMEHIEDELKDARTYAKLAVEYKHDDPELGDLFYKLSPILRITGGRRGNPGSHDGGV